MKSHSKERSIPVVGIGASAGGLEALEKFFKNMPADNGMAFVVDPERINHNCCDPTQNERGVGR
jgi:chemotaxis response regulator CheB